MGNSNRDTSRGVQGLCLGGTVIDRTRRYVPKDNPTTEIVTYTIQDANNHKYFVDDYAPSSYLELDRYACLPVYVKPYKIKNGDPSFNLNVQRASAEHGNGENF